jgi:hypothetical protein
MTFIFHVGSGWTGLDWVGLEGKRTWGHGPSSISPLWPRCKYSTHISTLTLIDGNATIIIQFSFGPATSSRPAGEARRPNGKDRVFGRFKKRHLSHSSAAVAGRVQIARTDKNGTFLSNTRKCISRTTGTCRKLAAAWACISRFTTTNASIKRWIIAHPKACISQPDETGCQLQMGPQGGAS